MLATVINPAGASRNGEGELMDGDTEGEGEGESSLDVNAENKRCPRLNTSLNGDEQGSGCREQCQQRQVVSLTLRQ